MTNINHEPLCYCDECVGELPNICQVCKDTIDDCECFVDDDDYDEAE